MIQLEGGVAAAPFAAMMAAFVAATVLLGIYGYRHTRDSQGFLLGREKTNSAVIALSYGATFLSASAIIGFGGQAAIHGMGLMWLCFLNLFLGLFVAFVVFGKRVRRMGRSLGASTFSELLGGIYGSRAIRAFAAAIILIMMPIYCAAVLKGGVNSIAVITGAGEYYNVILIVLAVLVGMYVAYGGIIAVMYNDALQAGIMLAGMAVILAVTYYTLGGVHAANSGLSDLWGTAISDPSLYTRSPGFNGWTSMAGFGTPEWLTLVTTFTLGVGIGALTQPQLVVRFMSARDDRTINKSLMIGSVFIFVIVGAAYTIGPLTNLYFFERYGETAINVQLGTDFIIPAFILDVFSGVRFGDVFVSLFLLALTCAAISTLSALMHTIGSAGGHDMLALWRGRGGLAGREGGSVRVNRACTAMAMVLVVVYCYLMPSDIIAKATSLFMGVTAATLLPMFAHGLYSKRPDRRAAMASAAAGAASYLFWALFVNAGSSVFLPVCRWITGRQVLFSGGIECVDALMVALPVSAAAMAALLLLSRARRAREASPEASPDPRGGR
ncbi:MAG: sodium:solute symporter family protein [Candidatus Methanoplasma sp.]|jgi:SSS family solute:Na+ symporter|nr:sodium:solute symporter family protein [Candidatus Methanoplasma sp.]